MQFFAKAGFPCPSRRNPSDHFLRCINSDFDAVTTTMMACQRVHVCMSNNLFYLYSHKFHNYYLSTSVFLSLFVSSAWLCLRLWLLLLFSLLKGKFNFIAGTCLIIRILYRSSKGSLHVALVKHRLTLKKKSDT